MKRLFMVVAACLAAPTARAVELRWDFESGIPADFFEARAWAQRDTSFTYGPRAPHGDGEIWVGTPPDDREQYPGFLVASLTTKEIDLAALGMTSFYVSWAQWGDFEGLTLNYDGAQFLISTDGGRSWTVLDAPPEGGLNPAYDEQIVPGGGTPISGQWAYCYDTIAGGEEGAPPPVYRNVEGGRSFQSAARIEVGWRTVSTQDLVALGYVTPEQTIRLRWLFASDALDGGQGYFIDDLRIADTPPECEIPPAISLDLLADTPDTSSEYEIIAEVTRVCADIDPALVKLHYWSEVDDTTTLTMTTAGGDAYRAAIPAQPLDTDVWYWVSAADILGNEGRTTVHSFEVTDAITLTIDDGQPYFIDPGFHAEGDGLAARFTATASADTTYELYKMLCFFARTGRFDVGVWQEAGGEGKPGDRVFASGHIGNDRVNQWWSFEFADSTVSFSAGAHFFVGYTFASNDSTENPAIAYDQTPDIAESSWRYVANNWQLDTAGNKGEPLLRVKVKKRVASGVGGSSGESALPSALRVVGNYPNPFNPRTEIRYLLPARAEAAPVRVTVFDLAGRAVAQLVDAPQRAGRHSVVWDGNSDKGLPVPSGVYFCRVQAGDETATRKMVLLK